MKRAEVLAPVGNHAMFDAAVKAGADSVYLAAKSFGARAYAANFTVEEIWEIADICHLRNMKLYVTMNTIIKETEMADALKLVKELYEAGVDALIVTDSGLVANIREILPDFELHASTQMGVSSLQGAKMCEEMGFHRVVLGRECTIEEVKEIADKTAIEIEIFVHGSLCVSVSGRCLMSSFGGGRSGNRGRCAQPCRKTYELVDAKGRVLGKEDTFLSPRDLCTADALNDFSGVDCLKIEGRMKKPEYVYEAVRAYKGKGVNRDLALATNRPFTKGLLLHDFGKDYVFSEEDKSGIFVGNIEKSGKNVHVTVQTALEKGDIITVTGKYSTFPLTLTEDFAAGEILDLSAYPDLKKDTQASLIYTARSQQALKSAEGPKIPLSFFVKLRSGHKAEITAKRAGFSYTYFGEKLEEAKNQPISFDDVSESMAKLGSTFYELVELEIDMDANLFIPRSILNSYRREAIKGLEEEILKPYRRKVGKLMKNEIPVIQQQRASLTLETDLLPSAYPSLRHISRVYIRDISLIEAWRRVGVKVFYMFPSVTDSKEYAEHEKNAALCDGTYCRGVNDLGAAKGSVILGRELLFMNSKGPLLFSEKKISAFMPSLECTKEEMESLIRNAPYPVEMDVYYRIPAMLLRHCPVSLYKGCRDENHCANCIWKSGVYLKDRYGKRELVREEGYTEVLLEDALDLRSRYADVLRMGASYLRIQQDAQVVADWQEILDGKKVFAKKGGRSFHPGIE